jgi:hypothetical protein
VGGFRRCLGGTWKGIGSGRRLVFEEVDRRCLCSCGWPEAEEMEDALRWVVVSMVSRDGVDLCYGEEGVC